MRRWVLIFAGLLPSAALADWDYASAPGGANDVQVADAGHYAVATSSGAFEYVGHDAGSLRLPNANGGAIGAHFDPAGCLGALDYSSALLPQVETKCLDGGGGSTPVSSAACSLGAFSTPAPERVRWAPEGFAYVMIADLGSATTSNYCFAADGGESPNDWAQLNFVPPGFERVAGIDAVRVAGAEDGLVSTGSQVFWATHAQEVDAGAALNAVDLQFVLNGSAPLGILVGNNTSGSGPALQWIDLTGPAPVLGPNPSGVPVGTSEVPGIFFALLSPDAGFGVATYQLSDGGSGLLSAVPDPSAPARYWLPSTNPPDAGSGQLYRLSCTQGVFCAILTTASGPPNNIVLYSNNHAPWIEVPAQLFVDAGQSLEASVDAGDNDGDAIFVTWTEIDAGAASVTVQPADAGADPQHLSVVLSATAGVLACGSQPVLFSVTATDGVHVSDAGLVTVNVQLGGTPDTPVALTNPLVIQAGGAGANVTFDGGQACGAAAYQLTAVSNPANVTWSITGNTANISAPAPWCIVDGGAVLDVVAVTDAGLASDAGTLFVNVLPTPPNPPIVVPSSVTLSVGNAAQVTLDAGPGLACQPIGFFTPPGCDPTTNVCIDGGSGNTEVVSLQTPWCDAGFGVATFNVYAVGVNGLQSDAGTFSVVVQASAPANPIVTPSSIQAGAAPQPLPIDAGVVGCATSSLQVTPACDLATGVCVDAGQLFAPTYWCSPDAGVATFSVVAFAQDGVDSGAVPLVVDLSPWGPPYPPFPGPQVFVLGAGDAGTYTIQQTHFCDDAGTGLPGFSTEWDLVGTAPAGVSANSATGATVTVDATAALYQVCTADSGVSFQVVNSIANESADSGVFVQIVPTFLPLAGGTLTIDAGAVDDGGFPVVVSLTQVNCLIVRGVTAAVAVDGGPYGAAVPLDTGTAQFEVPQPSGCGQGGLLISAQTFDADGGPGPSASVLVSYPARTPALQPLASGLLQARCGQPLNGQVTAVQVLNSCTDNVEWSWTASGNGIVVTADAGSALVQTTDDAFNHLFQEVQLTVTEDAGSFGSATASGTALIVPNPSPFVDVQHQTDSPITSESGIIGVEVTLTNETSCPVTHVSYSETLAGLDFVPGTARVNGTGVDAAIFGDQLVFTGLTIPAGSAGVTLQYSARPGFFSQPAPTGFAWMVDPSHAISAGGQGFTQNRLASGCGCSSSPGSSGFAFLTLLLGLAGFLRVRRAR